MPDTPPAITTAGIDYNIGQLDNDEAAFIALRRRVLSSGGIDLCKPDKNALRMQEKFSQWRKQGQQWLGVVVCDDGIISFWSARKDGRL